MGRPPNIDADIPRAVNDAKAKAARIKRSVLIAVQQAAIWKGMMQIDVNVQDQIRRNSLVAPALINLQTGALKDVVMSLARLFDPVDRDRASFYSIRLYLEHPHVVVALRAEAEDWNGARQPVWVDATPNEANSTPDLQDTWLFATRDMDGKCFDDARTKFLDGLSTVVDSWKDAIDAIRVTRNNYLAHDILVSDDTKKLIVSDVESLIGEVNALNEPLSVVMGDGVIQSSHLADSSRRSAEVLLRVIARGITAEEQDRGEKVARQSWD